MKKRFIILLVFFIGFLFCLYYSVNFDKSVDELIPKYTNAASRFIEVDNMNVHYRDEGDGPPVLLIHGTNASLHTWEGWVKALKANYRLIRLDMPGCGLTGPKPDGKYGITDIAQFVDNFVNKVGIDHFSIVGNSLGGQISWNYAVMFPDKVEKLILIDARGLPRDEASPFMVKLQKIPITKDLFTFITPRFAVEYGVKRVYGNDKLITDDIVERYFDLILRKGNRRAVSHMLNGTDTYSLVPRLKELKIPTLIMWGAKDVWILPKYAHQFKELIPNSKIIIYPELGHIPMEEAPNKTAMDANQFLSSS
ncbi:MAG: alpha/beta hydrolase [Proteobacteria bacterium]|nr:alpha/beta hydrolase [Pseudomonadota bacterium]